MKTNQFVALISSLATLSITSMAFAQSKPPAEDKAIEVMKSSFQARGQAKLDRLNQDMTMVLCTKYATTLLPKSVAKDIEAENFKSIPFPADGKYLGDWKAGERIAQLGRGQTFTDNPADPSGGNCYACHKLAPQELSFGTIGTSLYQFGKLRGYTSEIAKYAYGKIYNAQAYSACTNMPRFGHKQILTEVQIKDLVALLMDPESPVNK